MTFQEKVNTDGKYQTIFAKVVKKHGGRLTSERKTLLHTICNMQGHFEAEDILSALKKQGHQVSLATIYRNLSLIKDAGMIRRVSLTHGDPSRMQFECTWEQQHHDHLTCIDCGKKVEFNYSAIEVLQETLAKEHGFILTGHHLELLGLCPKCQEKSVTPLTDIQTNQIAKIVRLDGGKEIISRLHDFGLYKGHLIRLIRRAPFGGPLLIEEIHSKAQVMIARKSEPPCKAGS
ncbi:MAG: transcriptional repressor [Oligoflexia bacterium]|nr:transcriptional repressor [Oligoflexia bacterium]